MRGLVYDRTLLGNGALLLGIGLVASVFVPFALAMAVFSLSASLHPSFFFLGQLLGLTAIIIVGRREGIEYHYLASIALLLVLMIVGAVWLASFYYDLSWDGMSYHQEAIIHLANGWNPLKQDLQESVIYSIFINNYPKASWIYAALLFKVTGSIESGKAYHLILMLAGFLIVLAAALRIKRVPLWLGVWFATLSAANPVILYQSLSYYVDGPMGATLTAIAAVSLLLYLSPTKTLAALWIMLGVLAINLKFTGVPYVIVGGAGLILVAAVGRHWSLAMRSVQALMITLFFGIAIVGYNPYISNYIDHGHPFYPIFGDPPFDFGMRYQTPKGLQDGGRVQKMLTSLLSDSTNALEFTPELQAFSLLPPRGSITAFRTTDMRVGGWGPLFGRIVVVLGAGLLLCLLVARPLRYGGVVAGSLAIILVSVLVNPEAWWARYTPQLWVIPVSLGLWLLLQSSKVARYLGGVTLILLSLNTLLVAAVYYKYNHTVNAKLHSQLTSLAKSNTIFQADFGPFEALRERLSASGVRFSIVPTATLRCATPQVLVGTYRGVRLCMQAPALGR